jgi:hypothetical protein
MFDFANCFAVEDNTENDDAPRMLKVLGIVVFDGTCQLAAVEIAPNHTGEVDRIDYLDDLRFFTPESIDAASALYGELLAGHQALAAEQPADAAAPAPASEAAA